MASNAVAQTRPLAFMTRLTEFIYLYTPEPPPTAPAPATGVPPPKLILFCSWMGAGDKHIAKYLTRYQALHPTSPILLIRSNPKHIVFPSQGAAIAAPAVPVIRSLVAPSASSAEPPRLLVHAFSNAGSAVLSHLYTAFAATARAGTTDDTVFPPHSTVFDSTPGEATYSGSVAAFTQTVPQGWQRTLAYPIVHLLICTFWVVYIIPGRDILAWIAERHNQPALVREKRRAYVYSEADVSIPWEGIERHAAQARERGYEVRLEKFAGSAHVAHMVKDGERYWRIVKGVWEGFE